jgi:hypothetical protein
VTPSLLVTTGITLAPSAHDEHSRALDIRLAAKGVYDLLVMAIQLGSPPAHPHSAKYRVLLDDGAHTTPLGVNREAKGLSDH